MSFENKGCLQTFKALFHPLWCLLRGDWNLSPWSGAHKRSHHQRSASLTLRARRRGHHNDAQNPSRRPWCYDLLPSAQTRPTTEKDGQKRSYCRGGELWIVYQRFNHRLNRPFLPALRLYWEYLEFRRCFACFFVVSVLLADSPLWSIVL